MTVMKRQLIRLLMVCAGLAYFSCEIAAQDKVVVIPLIEESIIQCNCAGTLSSAGRWCDQGDGTVLDMTSCLVWLKKADWGGLKPWRINSACSDPDESCHDDAHRRVVSLFSGASGAELSDGSIAGDWRLPTLNEFENLTYGAERVRTGTPQFFTGVQMLYWTSNTHPVNTSNAYNADIAIGYWYSPDKTNSHYIWPVRGKN